MASAKARGTSREYSVKKRYEDDGYYCTRSSMSKGIWDLVCIKKTGVILIQVKSTNWPYGEEAREIEELLKHLPPNCKFICERFTKGKGWEIREYN